MPPTSGKLDETHAGGTVASAAVLGCGPSGEILTVACTGGDDAPPGEERIGGVAADAGFSPVHDARRKQIGGRPSHIQRYPLLEEGPDALGHRGDEAADAAVVLDVEHDGPFT